MKETAGLEKKGLAPSRLLPELVSAPPAALLRVGRGHSVPEPQVVDLPARVRKTSHTVSLVRRPHQLSGSPAQGTVSDLFKSF